MAKKPFFLFSKEETDTKVANNRLLAHAAGLTGQNMTYGFLSNRLFYFLNTILGIPAEKTGIVTGISTLWDAINDPIIGSFMDHRPHKPGNKMRPFLLYLPPIIGILVALMFVDFGLNETQAIICVAVLYVLFDTVYSFHDVAIWGISALTSPSSEERLRVTQWISIGAGTGGTIVGLFPMFKQWIVDGGAMSEKNTFTMFAFIFGLGGMIMAMLAYKQKEKITVANPEKENMKDVLKSLTNLRHNKTLIIICVARIVQSFSLSLAWEYFFESDGVTYNLFGSEITGGTAQVLYGYVMGVPGALINFFTVPVINKIGGNKKLLVYAEVANIATRLLAFAVGTNERYRNISSLLIVMTLLGSAQILTNMKGIAERALLTNSVDEMELKTGERTEGITFSMQNFVSKLTSAIPKFIQGYMLNWMGFEEKIMGPDGKMLEGSALIRAQKSTRFLKYRWHQFIIGPAIGAMLYLIVILFLKDDKEHTAQIEAELKKKREAASVEATA